MEESAAVDPEAALGAGDPYRTIVQTANEGIWLFDPAAATVFVNAQMAAILRYSVEDVACGTVFDFVPPEDLDLARERIDSTIQGTSEQFDLRFRRADGTIVETLACTSPVRDDGGAIIGALGMFTDISQRRQAQRRLARLLTVTAALSHAVQMDEVAPVVVEQGIAALGADAGTVLLMSDDRSALRIVASAGYEEGFRAAYQTVSLDQDIPAVDAVKSGEVICAESARAFGSRYPTLVARRKELGYEALACVPLMRDGQAEGALVLSFNRPRTFSADDLDFMRALAQQCTQAIERARLYAVEQQARRSAEEAQERATFLAEASDVLASSLDYETTLASVARLAVPRIADWCAVDIVMEDGSVRNLAAAHVDPAKVALARELQQQIPFDPEAPVGPAAVMRTGRPELVPEIDDDLLAAATPDKELLRILRELGLRASMVVPLIARGRVLGAITLIAAESGRTFGPADLSLAQDLAARAALAVDNARLYRESQRIGAERTAILRQMADGVAITDAAGRVTFVNEAAHRMIGEPQLGLTPEEAAVKFSVTTENGEPFPPDQMPLARALRERRPILDVEWRMRRTDDREIIMHSSAAPVLDDKGELLGAVSTYQDVTRQRTLERQKDDFLAAAAHDLKTPLATIKGLSQVLIRRLAAGIVDDTGRMLDGLQHIDAAVTRMTRLINELLDVTRIQMGRPLGLNWGQVDLVSLARRAAEDCRRLSDRHRVAVEVGVSELVGTWDEERLERVLANLLSNAVKYSPNGGPIIVTVDRDGDGWAIVSVQDHGVGIPADDLQHITERFYRASNVGEGVAGTGLGLASARQAVEAHGGELTVDSEEGVGTTVTVRLPLAAGDQAASEAAS